MEKLDQDDEKSNARRPPPPPPPRHQPNDEEERHQAVVAVEAANDTTLRPPAQPPPPPLDRPEQEASLEQHGPSPPYQHVDDGDDEMRQILALPPSLQVGDLLLVDNDNDQLLGVSSSVDDDFGLLSPLPSLQDNDNDDDNLSPSMRLVVRPPPLPPESPLPLLSFQQLSPLVVVELSSPQVPPPDEEPPDPGGGATILPLDLPPPTDRPPEPPPTLAIQQENGSEDSDQKPAAVVPTIGNPFISTSTEDPDPDDEEEDKKPAARDTPKGSPRNDDNEATTQQPILPGEYDREYPPVARMAEEGIGNQDEQAATIPPPDLAELDRFISENYAYCYSPTAATIAKVDNNSKDSQSKGRSQPTSHESNKRPRLQEDHVLVPPRQQPSCPAGKSQSTSLQSSVQPYLDALSRWSNERSLSLDRTKMEELARTAAANQAQHPNLPPLLPALHQRQRQDDNQHEEAPGVATSRHPVPAGSDRRPSSKEGKKRGKYRKPRIKTTQTISFPRDPIRTTQDRELALSEGANDCLDNAEPRAMAPTGEERQQQEDRILYANPPTSGNDDDNNEEEEESGSDDVQEEEKRNEDVEKED